MTEEQIGINLFNLYESHKDKVCDRIEKIFQTNLKVETNFNGFIHLNTSEVNQIYNYIKDHLEDFICFDEKMPLQEDDILICLDWWELKNSWEDLKLSTIKIIFSDKFIRVVKEILNERNIDYELHNFGF